MGRAFLLRHYFSKADEAEADQYAYEFILQSAYDPRAVGRGFQSLMAYHSGRLSGKTDGINPMRDYFMSHPPLAVREAEFREKAEAWWKLHPRERRYVGKLNLYRRRDIMRYDYLSEWVTEAGS